MNSITKLLLPALFLAHSTMAQDRHQHEIDSLQKLLQGSQKTTGDQRAATLITLGKIYMIRTDYLHADQCYTESLAIAEKDNNDSLAAQAYRSRSIIFFYQHAYAKAMADDYKALHLFEKAHDTPMQALALNSIADNYLQMGDSDRASAFFEKALPTFITRHDYRSQAGIYANQSILTHGDMRRSIALRLQAKTLWDKYPVENILPTINVGNLGEGYLDLVRYNSWKTIPPSDTFPHDRQKLLALGESYLRTTIRMAHTNGDVEDSSYFTGVLAELEEQKGDFRHAYYDFRAYQNITDSIYSQDNKNRLAEVENARAIEKKNQEIATKELLISDQHKKMWLLASCIALLAVTGGLVYRQGLIRKKNNAELQRLNTELDDANKVKARFFGILSHDLRSPVARLIHFLQLQEMEPGLLDPAEAEVQSIKIRQSAQTLLETMESVLLWSKGQMERFKPDFAPVAVSDLFAELERLYPSQDGISYTFLDEERLTLTTDRHYLRSILYNLTNNSSRAVAGMTGASIEWKAWTQDGKTHLAITDNGPGIRDKTQLSALFEETAIGGSSRGLGLHIIRDLARAIHCRIEATSLPDRGMRFIITIISSGKSSPAASP